jgi:hypothetical protein
MHIHHAEQFDIKTVAARIRRQMARDSATTQEIAAEAAETVALSCPFQHLAGIRRHHLIGLDSIPDQRRLCEWVISPNKYVDEATAYEWWSTLLLDRVGHQNNEDFRRAFWERLAAIVDQLRDDEGVDLLGSPQICGSWGCMDVIEIATPQVDDELGLVVDQLWAALTRPHRNNPVRPRRPRNRIETRPPGARKTFRRTHGPPKYAAVPPGWNVLVYAEQDSQRRIALRCLECNGTAMTPSLHGVPPLACPVCDGRGAFGIDPFLPTTGAQGSEAKVAIMVARYASGVALWNDLDRIGHTKADELRFRAEVTLISDKDEIDEEPW